MSIRIMRKLRSSTINASEKAYVLDTAVSGNTVTSGISFLTLEELLRKGYVSRDELFEVYSKRLNRIKDVDALLSLQSAERLWVHSSKPSNGQSSKLIEVVRSGKGIDAFTSTTKAQVEECTRTGKAEDLILASRMLLTKRADRDRLWIERATAKVIGKLRPIEPDFAEFLDYLVKHRRYE